MVLQEKERSIREAHQIQGQPVRPQRYAAMGGELLVELLTSGKLDVY